MRTLGKVLRGVEAKIQSDSWQDTPVPDISSDSRSVVPGGLFIAIRGLQVDGHHYVLKAIGTGASIIVVDREVERLAEIDNEVTVVFVKSTKEVLPLICNNFFDHPGARLTLVGVTGTNGKTSVATFMHRAWRRLGLQAGLLSTIENRIGDEVLPSTHTTPDIVSLYRLLSKMVEAGCSHVVMEVSSHALDQGRVEGLEFDLAIFTNITRDHIDYHGSFKNYLDAKKLLFDGLSRDAVAIVNGGDRHHEYMLQNCKAHTLTYGLSGAQDINTRVLESSVNFLRLTINGHEVITSMGGRYNAENLTAVYAALIQLGTDKEQALTVTSSLRAVSGRYESVDLGMQRLGIVDYAHTPDALANLLASVEANKLKNQRVILVIGCGGDRDKGKRPQMARIGEVNADLVVLTSDNPRSEDPEAIIQEMLAGVAKVEDVRIVVERRRAIEVAVEAAGTGDIVIVAGKGHEKYQEIKGVKHPFDDVRILTEVAMSQNMVKK